MAMASQSAVDSVKQFLARSRALGLPVVGGVLYGSQARGEARADSDIDLLVLVEDGLDEEAFEKVQLRLLHLLWDMDTRIEPRAIPAAAFELDQASPLIEVARDEGIYIAA